MTQMDIICMAEDAGLIEWSNTLEAYWCDAFGISQRDKDTTIEKFAELIAAKERNAVKKIALDILHKQLRDARFDDRQHLGLGDVRYTVGMENEFELELIDACEARGEI